MKQIIQPTEKASFGQRYVADQRGVHERNPDLQISTVLEPVQPGL